MADTFKFLQYAVEYGGLLGFNDVDGTCIAAGAMTECQGFIFFDDIHPTTFTHQYLAALALGQVKHGHISKEMKDLLKALNTVHPRIPFVVYCHYGDYTNDKEVLKEIEKAVKDIRKKDKVDLLGDIDSLIVQAAEIAITAIEEAEGCFGDAKNIKKAWKHFYKAEEKLEKEKFDNAVKEYRKAWENAQKVLKKFG
jgi:hypothetical protein